MTEKYKKVEKENQGKILKKKSKVHHQQPFNSSTMNHKKYRDCMQETKQSFSTQNIFRKSLSGKKQIKDVKLQKDISANNLQHLKMLHGNNRYFTEFSEGKHTKSKENTGKISFSTKKQHQRSTLQQQKTKNNRLSLSNKQYRNTSNTKKHKQNPSDQSEQSFLNVNKARMQLQSSIKKKCSRNTISRKQFIRITDKYERLLDRIIVSQSKPQQNTNYITCNTITQQKGNEMLTFRVEENTKKVLCPGIQLNCIKGMKINDYQDQFMLHYEELSESWKRDLAVQKRY